MFHFLLKDGTQFGDEYLAELDYIEVVECMKEGYESDVVEPESEGNEGQTGGHKSESEAEDEGKEDSKGDSDGYALHLRWNCVESAITLTTS